MLRIIIAAIVGGLILFVWSFVSWVYIPWHMINGLPNEQIVKRALVDSGTESGIYSLPGIDHKTHATLSEEAKKAAQDAWEAKYKEGPVALIVYRSDGMNPWSPVTMGIGFVIEVLVAAVAAILLSMAAPALPGYMKRVGFVVMLGVFVIFAATLMDWNWMHYPAGFTVGVAADGIVGAFLLGLLLAAIIRPGAAYGGVEDAADFPPDDTA
jgi:hypothetical protein